MTLFLLAALVIASAAAPVYAQPPAPAPQPQPPPAVETPEAEASRDIERIGEVATQNKAVDKLASAVKAANRLTEREGQSPAGGSATAGPTIPRYRTCATPSGITRGPTACPRTSTI